MQEKIKEGVAVFTGMISINFSLCVVANRIKFNLSVTFAFYYLGGSLVMAEGEGTASNAIWAVALIIIVGLIVGVVYYSGILKGSPKKEVDINISAPGR